MDFPVQILVVSFIILLILDVPVAFSMGIAAMLGILAMGNLPAVIESPEYAVDILLAYVGTYLKQEIQQEALDLRPAISSLGQDLTATRVIAQQTSIQTPGTISPEYERTISSIYISMEPLSTSQPNQPLQTSAHHMTSS